MATECLRRAKNLPLVAFAAEFRDFWAQLSNEGTGYSVIIEDDSTKAYAYLVDSARVIVSDVWLYNRGPAPETVDWSDPSKLPFSNPAEFVTDVDFKPIGSTSELLVQWQQSADRPIEAQLWIRGQLFAILRHGIAPGRSRLTAKDGPLAKVLEL
ncbi:hypothetical protein HFO97_02355 [Rhizobium leguminosarum]|uniref:hypothetical protein n=1 Tax=Rhizobium leguminosarum TaxID=384 RepID=UPI001C975936|nr:hypothetical protein [Rhizobium leguminosarum]MBY5358842.1 hypothetical protein [Rhizobium leguminosarum]